MATHQRNNDDSPNKENFVVETVVSEEDSICEVYWEIPSKYAKVEQNVEKNDDISVKSFNEFVILSNSEQELEEVTSEKQVEYKDDPRNLFIKHSIDELVNM